MKDSQIKRIRKIEFDLLENGLDFINNSLNPILESNNEHELKYSILHISAGLELLLKEILRNEHWSLIFEKVDSANLNSLLTGDFISASFETILNRLEKIAEIQISEDAKKYIRDIRKKRNRIEHFAFQENDVAIKSIVSNVLSHIHEIIRENLDMKEYSDKSQDLYKEILKKSTRFEEFTSLLNSHLKPDLDKLKLQKVKILDCPECFQHTLPIDENLKCLFCGYTDSPENVAHAYIENIREISEYEEIKDGGYFPLEDCPNCRARALLIHENSFICFSCLVVWNSDELKACDWCNELYEAKDDHDIGMCDDCRERKMEEFGEFD